MPCGLLRMVLHRANKIIANFCIFSLSPKLTYRYINSKQYKYFFEVFQLEGNKYCSTFTINIESSLIHPMHIYSLASKYNYIETLF